MFTFSLCGPSQAQTQDHAGFKNAWQSNFEELAREVDQLRIRLSIPGLAFAIVRDGEVAYNDAQGVTRDSLSFSTHTPLRIASVTKSFTAVLAMQAVERGELALSDPVAGFLPDFETEPTITIAHLLSHTSEGIPGEEYVYGTNRYALIADILAKVTGKPFDQLLRKRILQPAGMTWHASPHLGAHAGLVSTVEGLAKYAVALDEAQLLPRQSLEKIGAPVLSTKGYPLPIGLGWFSQEIQGKRVVWSFGQDDPEHSGALFMRIPEEKLTFIVLANANYLSDPFRLLMGDVRKSPFAMALLRLFVFSEVGTPLPQPVWQAPALAAQLGELEQRALYRYADELISEVLVHTWRKEMDAAASLWSVWWERYPEQASEPDPALLFPYVWLGQDPFTAVGIEMGEALLQTHARNRWILLPMAYLFEQKGKEDNAFSLYEQILALPNQHPDFLNKLFKAWSWTGMAKIERSRSPEKAKVYLEQVLALNVGGNTETEARALLEKFRP